MTTDFTWMPRGDGWHWDHPSDGCFIEKEHERLFALYDDHCGLLGTGKSLALAKQKHIDLCAAQVKSK